MNFLLKFTAILIESSVIGFAAVAAPAQGVDPQPVVADGSRTMLGRPESASPQMVLTGKPLTLIWDAQAGGDALSKVRVERITATRRIEVAAGEIRKLENQWSWSWTPPKTRSVVKYRVRLEAVPDQPILLQVYSADWLSELRHTMAAMKWEAQGLSTEELTALNQAGSGVIISRPQQKGVPARIRITGKGPGNPRLELTLDEENHEMTVWKPGTGANDVRIRAPRWWISPAALATDHGMIRFYQILSQIPAEP